MLNVNMAPKDYSCVFFYVFLTGYCSRWFLTLLRCKCVRCYGVVLWWIRRKIVMRIQWHYESWQRKYTKTTESTWAFCRLVMDWFWLSRNEPDISFWIAVCLWFFSFHFKLLREFNSFFCNLVFFFSKVCIIVLSILMIIIVKISYAVKTVHVVIITLAASSSKRNVTVWRPSVRPC